MPSSQAFDITDDTPDLIRTMAVDRFVEIINELWQHPSEHHFEVGKMLETAKAYYGARSKTWHDMKSQFPFSSAATNKLIAVATLPQRLFDQPQKLNQLPDVLGTLYEISRLEDNDLHQGLSSGKIQPGSTQAEIITFKSLCQQNTQTTNHSGPEVLSEEEILKRTVPLISIRVEESGLEPSAIRQLIEDANKLAASTPGVYVVSDEPVPQKTPETECSSLLDGMFKANHGHSKRDTFKQGLAKKVKPVSNPGPAVEDETDWTKSV